MLKAPLNVIQPRLTFAPFLQSPASSYVLPATALAILILLWQGAVMIWEIPQFVLPAPLAVLQAGDRWLALVSRNALQTLLTTLGGFALALMGGTLLGSLIGCSKWVYKTAYPLMVGFQTVPKVALVPLLALWFGIGTTPAVITAFLLAFFPIAVNVALGLATVEPEMQDVLRSLGASPWESFVKVGFPHTLPYLFASLKIAISQAFIGSVIAETLASRGGLGYVITSAGASFNVPLIYFCLGVLGIMGILLYTCFALVEQRTLHWRR